MSSESRFDGGAIRPSERTDPMLPAITEDTLPPLWEPRVPELNDHTLAELLAELDGDDIPQPRPATPRLALPRRPAAEPRQPAEPRRPAEPRQPAEPRGTADPPRTAPSREMPRRAAPRRVRPGRPTSSHPGRARPEASPVGPVTHSPYGDFRPTVERTREDRGLTGLTRSSRGRLGSLLFTAAFVLIFLVIAIETLVSLLTTP